MLGGAIKKSTDSGTSVTVHRSAEGTITTVSSALALVSAYDGASKATLTSSSSLGTVVKGQFKYINLTKGTRGSLGTAGADATKTLADVSTLIGSATTAFAENDKVRIFWQEVRTSSDTTSAIEITISPDTFPGSFRVVGDTFIRDQATGADSAFQFVIPNAKVSSEVTITLQAEGDPSTFSMTLDVLRESGEEFFKLIKY